LLVTQLLLGAGCNGGDGGVVGGGLQASFTGSGTSPAANLVYLRGGTVSGDMVTVEVVIVGPTTSQDLYSFVFDLVLSDPTVAAYEPGTAVFGTALTIGAGQGQLVQAVQNGDRVVCGVTKTGGGAGNGVGNLQATALSLVFRALKAGTTTLTLAGPPTGGDPAALDSNGAVIGSVTFDTASSQLSGS
jgi:hypothetical protein